MNGLLVAAVQVLASAWCVVILAALLLFGRELWRDRRDRREPLCVFVCGCPACERVDETVRLRERFLADQAEAAAVRS